MAGVNKQRGFTIIEVTLFLAVASLLLATMVFGMQRMVAQVRFNDSTNSLTAYVQAQYEEVRSGVNPRNVGDIGTVCAKVTNSAPGTSNCTLLGKIIHFDANTSNVTTTYVIGTKTPDSSLGDHAALQATGLVAVETGKESYEIQWGAKFSQGNAYDLTNNPKVDTLAILRSPVSSQVLVYTYLDSTSKTLAEKINGASAGTDTLNQPSVFVINSAEAFGQKNSGVCVDPGNISSAVHSVMPITTTSATTLREACRK